MFQVIEVTNHYNQRGDVRRQVRRSIFSSVDILETVRFRYARSANGYSVGEVTDAKSVSMVTEADGVRVDFAEMYRLVEGQAAFDAILNDEAPPVDEASWIAAKLKTPVVVRMARYEAAYKALHGRTVSVTWTGDKVRVLEHGGDSAYALHFDADELDGLSARMETKVAELAAARAAAANAPDDIFEALGLPKSAGESN